MTYRLLAAMLLLTLAAGSRGQNLDIAALGSLELAFETAIAVDTYPGQSVAAAVSFRPGDAFRVPSPGRVQQIEYLVEAGATVARGQPFAVLRGPEMHHVQMRYRASRELLEGAERRFNSNKALYERRSISESQWLEISENYYRVQLEFEHMRHFFELVVAVDEARDALTLGAPLDGIVDYAADRDRVEEGDSIAQFIPAEAIRLQASIPVDMRHALGSMTVAGCKLAVERIDAVVDVFFLRAWTDPLPADCPLLLGQQVLATPMLQGDAYRVPRQAVFQLQQQTHVLARSGNSLTALPVTVLGGEGESYLLASPLPLQGRDILVTSVSAVQGVILGLGGE